MKAFDENEWLKGAMEETTVQKVGKEMLADSQPVVAQESDVFKVDGYKSAEWCVSVIAPKFRNYMEIKGACAEWRKKLDEIEKRAEADYANTEATMLDKLIPWAQGFLEGDKSKSVILVNGKIGKRKNPDAVVVLDEAAALAALREHPKSEETIKVKESILKKPVKALLDAGERIDGVKLVPGSDKWYVECE